MSRYLGALSIKGLNKVGNALVPGETVEGTTFPSFETMGSAEHADRVLEDLPAGDRDGLGILLAVLGVLPQFVVTALFRFLEWLWEKELPMGAIGKQIRIGLRGTVFSLYYSGLKGKNYSGLSATELLDYRVMVYRDDLKT